MGLKTAKNLVSSRSEYNAYYSDMRGVDFSSEPSQVASNRFSYLVNMYKNYRSDGMAIETIPGYRKIVSELTDDGGVCYGLYATQTEDGRSVFFVHVGNRIYGIAQTNNAEGKFSTTGKPITYFTEDGTPSTDVTVEERELTTFEINGTLYFFTKTDSGATIIALKYTEETFSAEMLTPEGNFYDPTTYINLPPSGWQQDENNAYGAEYEQRNILSPYFYVKFISDGESTEFRIPESPDGLTLERVQTDAFGYIEGTWNLDGNILKYTGTNLPVAGEIIRVKLKKTIKSVKGASHPEDKDAAYLICGCTKACLFDNRVFLTGNPLCPNHIFWSGFNAKTGMIEPTYFGILDNMYDGVTSKITGIMAVSDTLVVLKGENSEGTMYFHKPYETGDDLQPKVYPSSRGVSSAGCLGACCNFLDDPVFVSRLGLEGIEHMSAGMERAVGHRSSNVDVMLLKCDLSRARLAEWDGYLLLLADGQLFMADSRQKFTHHTGSVQYEWYYVDTVGKWIDVEGSSEFIHAAEIVSVGGNVFFATENGHIFMFNFDQMETDGRLPSSAYSFAGRTIRCGCAFKADNCGIPHLTKSTVKKSTVVKLKPMPHSCAKVKVRTNKSPYHAINRLYSKRFDFADIEFSDFAFIGDEQTLFVIREKEKKWVEKQYYIYSDEFERPFALLDLAFRYQVIGRYKES